MTHIRRSYGSRVYTYFAVLVLVGTIAGCRSEEAVEPQKPVTLDISTSSLQLSEADTTKSATLTLSCGCGFLLDSIRYFGDTSVIRFTAQDSLAVSRHTHIVAAWYDPAITPPGPHSAAIAFVVYHTYRGVSYVYTDTIRAFAP